MTAANIPRQHIINHLKTTILSDMTSEHTNAANDIIIASNIAHGMYPILTFCQHSVITVFRHSVDAVQHILFTPYTYLARKDPLGPRHFSIPILRSIYSLKKIYSLIPTSIPPTPPHSFFPFESYRCFHTPINKLLFLLFNCHQPTRPLSFIQ